MLYEVDHLSISKRDADCYDVFYKAPMREPGAKAVSSGRIAALRSEFTEDAKGVRTMIPGTWIIRWEHKYDNEGEPGLRPFARDIPEAIEKLRFNTVHEAFAFFCSQVLV